MQENIEIIQNIIYNQNGDQMNYIDIDNGTPDNECETFITAIEYLIKGYKQLEEENRILKRTNSMAEDISIEDITQVMNKIYEDFMKEFVPTSLVKEKIEDLEKRGYFEGADAMKDLLERSGEDE